VGDNSVSVFTDGAAKGNPGPGGWGVVIVTSDEQVVELGGGAPHTTNNRMELTAAIAALDFLAPNPGHVTIHTDSTYVIKGITQWVWSWQRRAWKTAEGGDVLNRDLWEELAGLVAARGRTLITWHWVKGHNGTAGNERVDAIAAAFSQQREVDLYRGPLASYPLSVAPLTTSGAEPPAFTLTSQAARKKTTAHSYLSVVDGVLKRHATWSDCERHVKGRSGAKFKKTVSADDERAVLRQWGFD
jgi:ribonuclease HI